MCKKLYRGVGNTWTIGDLRVVRIFPTPYKALENDDELQLCILDCYQGYGVTNIKLLDWYRGRGICYPDSCAAEEILILQSNVQNVSNIAVFTDGEGYGKTYGVVSKL